MDNKITPWEDYNYSAKLPDFWEVTGATAGFMTYRCYKYINISPMPKRTFAAYLAASSFAGYLLGKAACTFRNNYTRRRQLFLDDYVSKHPEDFQPREPKKFKDVLWEWQPHR